MVIRNFYKDLEISAAKKDLWSDCNMTLGAYQACSNSPLWMALQAHLGGIYDAIRKLDAIMKLPDVVIGDLSIVLDRNTEEINFLYYVIRVCDVEKTCDQHTKTLESVLLDIMAIKGKSDVNDQ